MDDYFDDEITEHIRDDVFFDQFGTEQIMSGLAAAVVDTLGADSNAPAALLDDVIEKLDRA